MYSKEITRKNRTAIVIAIDQSSSMSGKMAMNGWAIPKSEAVAMVTGKLIDELLLRARRDIGYRDYYDIALLGYSEDRVYSLLGDEVAFHPITALALRSVPRQPYTLPYVTLNKGIVSICEEVSMWVKPRAQGATPMYKMITRVTQLVKEWCAREENRNSFPPLVFNITDGEASDCNYDMLRGAAARLRETGTTDGNTLFVNVHISSDTNHAPMAFPTHLEIPHSVRYAELLMDMSSIMPTRFNPYILKCRERIAEPPYLAMSYNASMPELITMLNIGSRSLLIGK